MKLSTFLIFLLSLSYFHANSQSIAEIQGNGLFSPLLNDQVSIAMAVVTASHDDMLFVQTSATDGNLSSSDGLMIRWDDAEDFIPNDLVEIRGTVREFDDNTTVDAQMVTKIGVSTEPIVPIAINNDFPGSALQSINPLEIVEGQLISFTNLSITNPSIGNDLAYISGSDIRPFREPGIEAPGINNLPEWDGNPESFYFVPDGLGLSSNAFLNANMRISGTGIIVQETFNYAIYPITYFVSEEAAPTLIQPSTDTEFNIGCLNTLFLEQEDAQYELRLDKMAQYIRDQLGTPDVVALQEVGGTQEFIDLARVLSELTSLEYTAYSKNATGNINNGYLVQQTFTVSELETLGTGLSFDGGGLHDRAPLLLEGFINTASGQKQLSILNLHMRSLNGIDGDSGDFVRRKRLAQAVSVSQMVRSLQEEDNNIVVVGDYNAFQFSDGYVDVVNQIAGTSSLGALLENQEQGVTPLINISATFPPIDERYSYVFRGNAQILDHCLVSDFTNFSVSHFHFGRGNCDYPDSYLNQDISYRASDHDGFSLYLDMNEEVVLGAATISSIEGINVPNPFLSDSQITFALDRKQNLQLTIYSLKGQVMYETSLGAIENDKVPLPYLQTFTSGMYVMKITGNSVEVTQKIILIQ